MRIEVDYRESVQENAARYYEKSKKQREKAKGAARAAEDTKKKLKRLDKEIEKEEEKAEKEKPGVRVKREKKWFERFRWFKTSGGLLVLAGRDAKQNELLVSRHLEPGDLFFHAEVHGAPATVLKEGQSAGDADKREAAQFAGSYSSAWKLGSATVDVYAVLPEQVSKRAESGEHVGKGGFIIRGEREWFKSTSLGLLVGVRNGVVRAAPLLRGPKGFSSFAEVLPGNVSKGDAAKMVLKRIGKSARVDEVLQLLPNGGSIVR